MFRLNPEADADMTYFVAEIDVAPALLIELFGHPAPADGYKVSGQFRFTNSDGAVFNIYDWKTTSLYLSDAPTPQEFWAMREPYTLYVAGLSDPRVFLDWLRAVIVNYAKLWDNPSAAFSVWVSG